jgi:7-keto-8-aminopelargonate synthetase-like enzyme
MDRKRHRLEKQKNYQREYRARKKRERAPERDDIARALLHYAITENLEHGRHPELTRLIEAISERLEEQGFSASGTRQAWHDLVVRYGEGWTFQRKPHLLVVGDHEDSSGS